MNNNFIEQYYITKMIQNPIIKHLEVETKKQKLLKNYNIHCEKDVFIELEHNVIKNSQKMKCTNVFLAAIKKRKPVKEILKNMPDFNNLYYLVNGGFTKVENPLIEIFKNFSSYQINYLIEKKLLSEDDNNLLVNVLLKRNDSENLDKVFNKLKDNEFILSDIRVPVLIMLGSLKNNVTEEELETEKYKENEFKKFNKKIELLKILINNDKYVYEEIIKILSIKNLQELIEAEDDQKHFNRVIANFNIYGSKKFYGREFIINLIKIGIEQKVLQNHINSEVKNDIVTNKKKSSRL